MSRKNKSSNGLQGSRGGMGATPREAIESHVRAAVDLIGKYIAWDDDEPLPRSARDRLKAAFAILDRAGYGPTSKTEVTGKDGKALAPRMSYLEAKKAVEEADRIIEAAGAELARGDDP